MSNMLSSGTSLLKRLAIAGTLIASLGVAAIVTVEPAQARDGAGSYRYAGHFGGARFYGWRGYGWRGYGWRARRWGW